GLIDRREMARIRRVSRLEFWIAMTALVGVLLLGILKGVLLAVVGSILLLLHQVAYPHVALLGRIPHTRRFSDLERHPDNERIPGVMAVRVESSLVYFNVEHVLQEVLRRLNAEPGPVRLLGCDLSTSPYVDIAGAQMLTKLCTVLSARGAILRLVEAHSSARDTLRAEGLELAVGQISRRASLADAIEAFERGEGSPRPG